ncbi:MAG: YARHG domain-containing protein [Ekhidna sp.]|nr:YARHG domain-containing protein [Ekhidna sp.]
MKLFSTYNLILLLPIIVFSCSTKGNSEQASTSETSASEVLADQEVDEEDESTGVFSFRGKHQGILKEQLFYFLRERILNVEQNTFVKQENLQLNGLDFEYTAVIMDWNVLTPIAMNNSNSIVRFASYNQSIPNELLGDSIRIEGSIQIQESTSARLESELTDVTIQVTGDYSNSYPEYNNYTQEMERINSQDFIQEELIVKLNEPRIYNKENLFMKARIAELKKEDLQGMSSDELAFLRNEIFARHGHNFKTDKMRDYFREQSWYKPYFDDVTAFLNETEKKNAQFIKSLES